jgi:tetratricopeptide (TPR) repeat protein
MIARAVALLAVSLVATASILEAWGQTAPRAPADLQAIGKLLNVTGAVTVERSGAVVVQASAPSGGNGQAKAGDLVYQGDVIQTGPTGAVGMVFTDGTSFNVSSNARMEMNEFIYDPKSTANSTLLSLKKGAFTFIAGSIAKTGDMKIETPVGTMGIRGTAPHVVVSEDGTVRFSTLIEENKKTGASTPSSAPSQRRARSSSSPDAASAPRRSALRDLESCNGANRVSAELQIAACTALIETQIDTPQALAIAYSNRGNARVNKGDTDLAIADYNESIKLDPAFAKAFNNRGIAYTRKGDLDRAIADFDAAIAMTPDYAGGLANRARAYERKRDYDRALSDLNEAIRIQPALASLRNERCWIRAIKGLTDDALADCNEAIRLGPASAAKFDSRGLTYLKMSRWDLAIADFNSALQMDPGLASSRYGRGLAKTKAGDLAGGRADIAAATRAKAGVAQEFAGYGVQ